MDGWILVLLHLKLDMLYRLSGKERRAEAVAATGPRRRPHSNRTSTASAQAWRNALRLTPEVRPMAI